MESKFDWLTLTLKPENLNITYEDCFSVLVDKLLLGDLIGKMIFRGHYAFYDYCYTYENIAFCYTDAERFVEQGICFRMSSQGLDYFTRYLKTYNITLKQWLGMWRALCFEGYVSKVTRFDYAMDDIRLNGEKPVLTLKKVLNCLKRGEMCKKAKVARLHDGDCISVQERYKTVNKEPVIGRTLNVGSRQSEVFCRFYDKLAEQIQKKEEIPENCTAWTRCEFEFKHGAAMCVFNAFLDMSDEDFAKYMCGVVNNYCRFIVRNSSNVSRCSLKRWWVNFLKGCTDKFRLPHKSPSRSAFAKARRGLRQYVPTIFTMFQEIGLDGVYEFFENEVKQKRSKGAVLFKPELANNIREAVIDYEEMNGFKAYRYNSFDGEEGWNIAENILYQRYHYYEALWKVQRNVGYEDYVHKAFVDGQEVLE